MRCDLIRVLRRGRRPWSHPTHNAPVNPGAWRFAWIVRGTDAALRSDQAAIVACDCSPHGPRSPVGETQRSQ